MIRLRHCMMVPTDNGVTTVFSDGSRTSAFFHDMPHYHVIAHRCGYGDDILTYCREHELAHNVVAEFFFAGESPVLAAQARGTTPPPMASATAEELLAQTLQRWARANERPIVAGVDWDALRRVFLRYARRLND